MTDPICPEFSLMWPLLVFFTGIAVVAVLIARRNGFGVGKTIGALTGMQKFKGSRAIYLLFAGTVIATVAVYFMVLPACIPA